jgi:hypothetical protein
MFHLQKHKEGGGKGYKGSEHKQKHKGGFKKGDEGAKGKKVGHKGKFHKGHHDKVVGESSPSKSAPQYCDHSGVYSDN